MSLEIRDRDVFIVPEEGIRIVDLVTEILMRHLQNAVWILYQKTWICLPWYFADLTSIVTVSFPE
jgi:hypothetical protein